MSAPILDSTKTLETKLQENKSQPLKPQDSKPKDDGAVKKNVSESGNLDRFDTQNISGVSFGRASCNQKTNTQQNQFFLIFDFFFQNLGNGFPFGFVSLFL